MSKRAFIYCRVSSEEQTKGHSLETQLQDLQEFANRRDWDIIGEYSEVISATLLPEERPKMSVLMNDINTLKPDFMIVRDSSRLSRVEDVWMTLKLLAELRDKGVKVFDQNGKHLDPNDIGTIVSAYQDSDFIRRLKANVKRGRLQAVKKGKVLVTQAPYGYRKIDEIPGIEPVSEEAEVVKLIFKLCIQGLSLRAIAKEFTLERNIPTPTMSGHNVSAFKRNKGLAWRETTLRKIINDETYSGTWWYGRTSTDEKTKKRITNPKEEWTAVEVDRVVSKQTQQQAIKQLKINRKKRNPKRKYKYLMAGRIKCGKCGLSYIGNTKTYKNKKYGYYICGGKFEKASVDMKTKRCDMPNLRVEDVDEIAKTYISMMLLEPVMFYNAIREHLENQDRTLEPIYQELEVRNDELGKLEAKRNKLLDLYLDGNVCKDLLEGRLLKLDQEKAVLEGRLVVLESDLRNLASQSLQKITLEDIERKFEELQLGWMEPNQPNQLSFKHYRELIKILGLQFTHHPDQGRWIELKLNLPFDERGVFQLLPLDLLGEELANVFAFG